MTSPTTTDRPVRVGVFESITAADRAVQQLLAEEFTKEQITVISSSESKAKWFKEFQHQPPAGANTPAAAVGGGAIGATLGGFTALAVGASIAGAPLLLAGGLAAWTGAVVGGLVGAMMTRGVEKEAANFYDQSVQAGKLLVAVEEPDHPDRLNRAAAILRSAGAEPQPLVEG